MKRANKILLIMVMCALVALGFGFYVMKSRTGPLPENQQANANPDQNQGETKDEEADVPTQDAVISTAGWKTYTNDKHVFSVDYPPVLKAGSISENSVLGTFEVPVRGYHVGPLVFVVLKDADIKRDAKELFDNVYSSAKNPQPVLGEEVLPVECKIVLDMADRKAVACDGEGGPAKYAYLTGPSYDVFVDGYSKGYANQDNGNLKDDKELIGILTTFSFTIKSSSTPASAEGTEPATANTTPVIQSFTINADDTAATPSEISVTKDAIVQITFTVGANTYYGGLDFKSSVVNSGTVNAGQSKTISFKATQSFEFTPYWPASSIAKNYKIRVTVL